LTGEYPFERVAGKRDRRPPGTRKQLFGLVFDRFFAALGDDPGEAVV
jgi:hypothetical protein